MAPIAPATIWPSTPMFHSPAWNVTISPAAASTSGIHVINVSENFASVPNEPSHSRRSASSGGASTSDEEQHGDAEGDGDADDRDGRALASQRLTRRRPPIRWPSSSASVAAASTTSRIRPAKNTAMRSL